MMTTYDENTKIWSGPQIHNPFLNSQSSLGEMILKSLKAEPDRIIQISHDEGQELTCKEFLSLSIRSAQNLTKMGLKQGDVIAFLAKNSTKLAPLLHGCIFNGLPVNPIYPESTKADIVRMLKITKPKVVFCDPECMLKLKKSIFELNYRPQIFTMIEEVDGFPYVDELFEETDEDNFKMPQLVEGSNAILGILATSGTTSALKATCLGHGSLMLGYYMELLRSKEPVVSVQLRPIYWVSSFFSFISCSISQKTRVISKEPFSQDLYIDLIKLYKANVAFGASVQISTMLQDNALMKRADFSSVKMFACAGSVISIDLLKQLKEYLQDGIIVVSYSMTEAGGGIANIINPDLQNCVGKLSANVSVKILDDEGRQLGINQPGELLVKAPFPFKGYYNNPQANKAAVDENGWFLTGDTGYFDADGNLFVMGRVKDVILYNENNVSCNELEAFIQKIPGVSLVSAVGVFDGVTDLPAAVIVKVPGSALKESEVIHQVADNYPDQYKLRGGVFFIDFDEMPMTNSGKIIRRLVKEIAVQKMKHH